MVVHTEHTHILQGRRIRIPLIGRRKSLAQLHRKPECAAFSRGALHANCPSHELDQAFRNRQPKTRPTIFACGRAVGLRKGLEQLGLHVAWDANTRVGDRHVEEGIVGRFFCQGDMDHHLAALGELDRIAHKIGQHLAHAPWVPTHPGGKARIQETGEIQPFTVGAFGQELQHILHHHA